MNDESVFYIAQYVPDPFRQESSNVGVIIEKAGRLFARFFGETEKGSLSRSEAKRLVNYPGIYQQWVEFWRSEIAKGTDGLAAILEEPKNNFRVIKGGAVSETNGDSALVIVDHLYERIVSRKHDARPKSQTAIQRLETQIRNVFESVGLLDEQSLTAVPNPVKYHAPVAGIVTEHVPSFTQSNGVLWVMNTISVGLSTTPRTISDRAGSTAYMFEDIKGMGKTRVKTIAIKRISSKMLEEESVKRMNQIIESASDQVVDWENESERKEFIEERIEVAKS